MLSISCPKGGVLLPNSVGSLDGLGDGLPYGLDSSSAEHPCSRPRLSRKNHTIPRSASAATPTPTPIPVFAPVDSPADAESWLLLLSEEDEHVGLGRDVDELCIADVLDVAISVFDDTVVVLTRSKLPNLTRIEFAFMPPVMLVVQNLLLRSIEICHSHCDVGADCTAAFVKPAFAEIVATIMSVLLGGYRIPCEVRVLGHCTLNALPPQKQLLYYTNHYGHGNQGFHWSLYYRLQTSCHRRMLDQSLEFRARWELQTIGQLLLYLKKPGLLIPYLQLCVVVRSNRYMHLQYAL